MVWLSRLSSIIAALALASLSSTAAHAQTRVKDLVEVQGVRDNQLVGYGLVVGLAGTGDRIQNIPFTDRSLRAMLERFGVAVPPDGGGAANQLRTRNVAAVMVTARLGPFARAGGAIDVEVSALGDANSLLGGVLLPTPLSAGDGRIYAQAQGPLIVQGFAAGGEAASVQRGVPTSARIPNGATVERELGFQFADLERLRLSLRHPDFTTAVRVAERINDTFGDVAAAIDPTTVDLETPREFRGREAYFIAEIEGLLVDPDAAARVVVDERTGTVVIGASVRLSAVAITQGGITISISETPVASQPSPGSKQGETVVLPRTNVQVAEGGQSGRFEVVGGVATLQELVDGLNALGVGARDIIAILEAAKAAGALHAELIVK